MQSRATPCAYFRVQFALVRLSKKWWLPLFKIHRYTGLGLGVSIVTTTSHLFEFYYTALFAPIVRITSGNRLVNGKFRQFEKKIADIGKKANIGNLFQSRSSLRRKLPQLQIPSFRICWVTAHFLNCQYTQLLHRSSVMAYPPFHRRLGRFLPRPPGRFPKSSVSVGYSVFPAVQEPKDSFPRFVQVSDSTLRLAAKTPHLPKYDCAIRR